MDLKSVRLEFPEECNIILGQSHFIKTIEDLYEIMTTTLPSARFGIAFSEASQDRLVRKDGNDEDMIGIAVKNCLAISAGHCFVIVMKDAYPINVLPRIKDCQEVCSLFCATANPVEVIVAESDLGRGILGVIDGLTPKGVEEKSHIESRKSFLRKIGYKR